MNDLAGSASAQRTAAAARLQIHARVLSGLAEGTPGPDAAGRLQFAARRAFALAQELNGDRSEPGQEVPGGPSGIDGAAETPALPTGTPTAKPTASPTQERDRFRLSATPEAAGSGWQTPGPHGAPVATAGTRGPSSTPGPSGPQPVTPGLRSTVPPTRTQTLGPGPVATAAGNTQGTPAGSGGPSAAPTAKSGGSGEPSGMGAGPGGASVTAAPSTGNGGSGSGRASGGK